MEVAAETLAFLAAIAFLAGTIDALAGGGGLLTLPAMMAAGVPPVAALATNKLQSTIGTASAFHTFWRAGHVDLRQFAVPAAAAFVGSALGATAVQHISSAFLAGLGKQETGFNASLVSPVGAKGPMQFMDYTYPSWAKDDDGNGTASPTDIGDAVMAAGRYSCDNARIVDEAIAKGTVKAPADGGAHKLYAESYNAGVGAILEAGGEPSGGDYDVQTRPYGTNVVRYMHEFAQQGLDQR